MANLTDKKAIMQVIGCFLHDPNLLLEMGDKGLIDKDFDSRLSHMIYIAINRLYSSNANKIKISDIDQYIEQDESLHKEFMKSGGISYLQSCFDIAQPDNFEYYYARVKKFTLLRALQKMGIDVSSIYDDNIDDAVKQAALFEQFDQMTIDDIFLVFNKKLGKLEYEYALQTKEKPEAGEGILELLEDLRKTPEIGPPLSGEFYNSIVRGARRGTLYLNSSSMGGGKALMNGTGVLTPNGYISIENLKVGDKVFDDTGFATKVIGVYPQGKKEIFEVTFSDNSIIKCCEDHLWNVATHEQRRQNKYVTKPLKHIDTQALQICETNNNQRWNCYIPMCQPVQFSKRDLPIAPYALGALLGDGYLRKGGKSFTNFDTDVIDRVNRELQEIGACFHKGGKDGSYEIATISGRKNNLSLLLRNLGLEGTHSNTKFIPEIYKFSSVEDRLAILQGLIDTDGFCKGSSYDIVLNSKQMILDIKFIVESLGMTAVFTTKRAICTNSPEGRKDCGIAYRLYIKTSSFIPKIHWCKSRDKRWKPSQSYARRSIRSIRATGKYAPMTCICVDSPSYLFLTENCIVTHNSRRLFTDATMLACSERFNLKEEEWITSNMKWPTLIITTELTKQEVQTIILAHISGVNEAHIKRSTYLAGEEERVLKAAEIIKNSKLFIERIADPSMTSVKNVIKRYVMTHGVMAVFYDYIFASSNLLSEFGRSGLRTDQILNTFTTMLKDVATQYQIFIASGSQLSGNYKGSTEMRGEELLRDAKSIADKVDIGCITMRIQKQDIEKLTPIVSDLQLPMPTHVCDVYKNRAGKGVYIRIWGTYDLGTMVFTDYFVTDNFYNPIENTDF